MTKETVFYELLMAAPIGQKPHTKTYFVFIKIGERTISTYSLSPVRLLGFQHITA